MKTRTMRVGLAASIVALAWLNGPAPASAQSSISGSIYNSSEWRESIAGPPGNNDGQGQLLYAAVLNGSAMDMGVATNGTLPFPYGPYGFTLGGALPAGEYTVLAWVDGNEDGNFDTGEPWGSAVVSLDGSNAVFGLSIPLSDDVDEDQLPDWWEYHWFRFTPDWRSQTGDMDTDADGLLNKDEARISIMNPGLEDLNPNNWDTDGDDMDDKWEWEHYSAEFRRGMNPCRTNKMEDFDGDGLSDWQEYCGVDGYPPMVAGQRVNGTDKGLASKLAADDLNPLDIDTDFDMLIDSFEAAWYDPVADIVPHVGSPNSSGATNVNTDIAEADPDQDGLSNYREQCLLMEMREAGPNGSKWVWAGRTPFPFTLSYREDGSAIRICTNNPPLNLGLVMTNNIPASTNRFQLRNQQWNEWTDPTEGTGYDYVDEATISPNPGHDTDGDWLPDGWEVEFGLDPRDDGFGDVDQGPFGDPDHDGIWNYFEYLGQDELRFTTREYVNGTGDETNPKQHNWRPDSTYKWRWFPTNSVTGASQTDPRDGTGISRAETMGSAFPTTSIGSDPGDDSDDDALTDWKEIHAATGTASSPVSSCDPFLPKSVLITHAAGILIPDPEKALAGERLASPEGFREDLQRRDWTLECQVKLLSTNLNGDLFCYQTAAGDVGLTVYRLSLSNNIPVLMSHSPGSVPVLYTVKANALPTNQWVHLAAVWDHLNNGSGLYIDGVLYAALAQRVESSSTLMFPATNVLALAASPDGSFTNHLMLDEVRIWGVARSQAQVSEFAHKLVPPSNGDDVWVDDGQEPFQYYSHSDSVIVNGGSLFAGEPGVALTNVYRSANSANFWIDNGDKQYNAARDVLLKRDKTLVEGLSGTPVGNVRWNDKDGSGAYSRDSLLAYYRFDDGGSTAEDFARRAKTGLIGATREEYGFGDHGYALPTNNFSWVTNNNFSSVTNGAALVYGVDKRGADDADGDGMPDGWELNNALDPWDNGVIDESYVGARDGFGGPQGDPDGDGLVNLYEFWSGTNPRLEDSDGNWYYDVEEDRDLDGLENIIEQELQSRPDMADTDDDGVIDSDEAAAGTSPADPTDPSKSLAVVFGGSRTDYLEVPTALKQKLKDWTLEAWVSPTNLAEGAGIMVRRTVANLAGGAYAVNYVMGLETNGSGGLRVYAGFIKYNGTNCMVRGGLVPVGSEWTHVAASYSSTSRTLSLYTNGALVAVTNFSLVATPPMDGPGGETFLRLGEDFAGGIDEVRIWSRVRSAAEIRANMSHVVLGSDYAGLIHYFRFDDGEADTNTVAWSEFHQPGGLQDFTYTRDWNEQWRHAARRHGNTVLAESAAIVAPPSLRVMLTPDEARFAGAQWMVVDDGVWQNSGTSLQGLTPGDHVLLFKSIVGWTEPASETITLVNGEATTITRAYEQKASLTVNIEPLDVRALDAKWRLDGGAWLSSGTTISNLNAGAHSLTFSVIDGWTEPGLVALVLTAGQAASVTRSYSRKYGSVSVTLHPDEAVAAGAQWSINGGTWQNSGALVGNLALDDYTIEFRSIPQWIAPASVAISITNEQTVVLSGTYSRIPGLIVNIQPSSAVASGAQWRLSGGEWTNSGVQVDLSPGSYTVEFKDVASWLAPGNLSAVVLTQQVTVVTGVYFNAAVFGGTAGLAPGEFREPRGLALDSMHRLYVADSLNNRIQRYDPYDGSWTVWGHTNAGQSGTNYGEFAEPSGLVVDSQGNVYVADSNNNRIQKRSATNGQWRAWGVYGIAPGQFETPSDVDLDSRTNLYVTDLYNDRVQKMSAAGTWSVFITNDTMTGHLTRPKGVLVNSNVIYVSDANTQPGGRSRIQKFSTNSQFVSVFGGDLPAEGGLMWPSGMTLGNGNLYVADSGNHRVAVSSVTNTAWTTLIGNGVLNGPQDVVWDPRGVLYIADTLNHRVISLVVVDGATNVPVQFSQMTSSDSNSVVISWFGRLNWYYSVQYVDSLGASVWLGVPGCTNILGRGVDTNCTDNTVGGAINRFYRIIAY